MKLYCIGIGPGGEEQMTPRCCVSWTIPAARCGC